MLNIGSSKDLKQCPFCGSKAELLDIGWPHKVYCTECGANVTGLRFGEDGDAQAIMKWNGRASEHDEPRQLIEAMRDVDVEKVEKGLEYCIASNNSHCPNECPYKAICRAAEGTQDVYVHLMEDALTLIRQQQERIKELEAAQTARVMTLEEVRNAENCMEPVFVEMLHHHGKADITPDVFSWRFVKHITPLTDGDIYVLQNADINSALFEETYNITWRCWTQRPTDEQRKAVPWE